jgi:putative ABC transport system permease protein
MNDKGKFAALLIGITFSVFLMMQMTAMFAGILNRAYSNVTNIGATMWIMDPAVNTVAGPIPMPNYLLDAVRSMDGVTYAVPLFIGGAMIKLESRVRRGRLCSCGWRVNRKDDVEDIDHVRS